MRAAIMFTTFSLKGCSLVESPCRLHTERLTNQWLRFESLTCAVLLEYLLSSAGCQQKLNSEC